MLRTGEAVDCGLRLRFLTVLFMGSGSGSRGLKNLNLTVFNTILAPTTKNKHSKKKVAVQTKPSKKETKAFFIFHLTNTLTF